MSSLPPKQKADPPESVAEAYGDIQGIAKILYWFIGLISAGLVGGIFIVLSTNEIFAATLIAFTLIPVLVSVFLVRYKKFEITAFLLAVLLTTLVTIIATLDLGVHHISVLGYPVILIVASLVVRKRTMVYLTAYNVICVAWLVFGELNGLYTPSKLERSVPGDFFSVSMILILTAFFVRLLAEALLKSNRALRKELAERKITEEKYRAIVENSIHGIFQSTPAGRFLSLNSAMADMYGYDSAQEMIDSITDISSQIYVDPNARIELQNRLAAGEKLFGFETQDYRKDGSTFWTSLNVQAIRDEKGEIIYYEGTVEDITYHRSADEALRSSEERYRTLFSGVLEGIYRSTPEGRFVDVNPAMARMFGYDSREEMLDVDIKSALFFSPKDRKSDYLAPGEERVDIFPMKRKDGSKIWVEDHGHYVYDGDGKIIFHEGLLRDVTLHVIAEAERKQAEEALLQFKTIMDNSNDAIFIIHSETGQYIYFNKRARLLLGYSREELGQLSIMSIASHISDLSVWNERVELVRKNNGLIFETSYRHKDGNTFPVEVSARLLQYAEDESIVAFVRDITERKQAEQERENLITELEAKNNELTQFTYTVSHDLKSPLVTINGYLGYIEQDAQSGNMERLQNDTRRIREATNKMHTLLTELLELSRIGRLMNTPESVPFDEIVREAVDVVHGQLDSRGVTVQTQPNLPIVHGDRQRLIEVLQNLLDNAAKYMGSQKNPLIVIGQQEEENGNPIYFVKDNGIGIAPEYHERIFGLFNKLDATTEGTGIGLALVKRIIEVHGGRIWVESELGKGSTFFLTLQSVPES
jgi:PAS domain S-box-containing protein